MDSSRIFLQRLLNLKLLTLKIEKFLLESEKIINFQTLMKIFVVRRKFKINLKLVNLRLEIVSLKLIKSLPFKFSLHRPTLEHHSSSVKSKLKYSFWLGKNPKDRKNPLL